MAKQKDFGGTATTAVRPPDAGAALEGALQQADALEDEINTMTEELKLKRAFHAYLVEHVVTDLVDIQHLNDGALLSDGRIVHFKPDVKASVAREFREKAHEYLDEIGDGNLLRRTITISCGKDADEKTQTIMNMVKLMTNQVPDVTVEVSTELPGSTMVAWVKRKLVAGEHIPPYFGLFVPLRAQYTTTDQ